MPVLDAVELAGPLVVTVLYVALYYGTQVNILRVKSRLSREYKARGERFDRYRGQDKTLLAADRVQLNMLEHMPPFLALMWLDALFVGPVGATVAGGVYLAARAAYPFLMGARLGRGVRASILVATVPGYVVVMYFCGRLLVAALGTL